MYWPLILFSLIIRLVPCFHDVESAAFMPYMNLAEGIEKSLFDKQIMYSNNDSFHLINGKHLIEYGTQEIIGDKRDIILQLKDGFSYVRDDAKVFYMGSRQMSRKSVFHFVYMYIEDTIQYVLMLCEYNGMIYSIIEVEHTIKIPFGDKYESMLHKLYNNLCIIEDEYESDDLQIDGAWATDITSYFLFIRKGVVRKCLYRQK